MISESRLEYRLDKKRVTDMYAASNHQCYLIICCYYHFEDKTMT
jgi:hypothetical protein